MSIIRNDHPRPLFSTLFILIVSSRQGHPHYVSADVIDNSFAHKHTSAHAVFLTSNWNVNKLRTAFLREPRTKHDLSRCLISCFLPSNLPNPRLVCKKSESVQHLRSNKNCTLSNGWGTVVILCLCFVFRTCHSIAISVVKFQQETFPAMVTWVHYQHDDDVSLSDSTRAAVCQQHTHSLRHQIARNIVGFQLELCPLNSLPERN